MKVKIKGEIFDANETPIMIILSESDKENIASMHPNATKYCAFPDDMSVEAVKEFMKT